MTHAILLSILVAALVVLLVWVGIEDVRSREIANWKNAAIALLAPGWWWANGLALWPDIGVQLGVATAVFAVFCVVFHFGWMGGGDVKLIGAVALWLPPAALAGMLEVMALVGGAITLVMMGERALTRRGAAIEIPYGVAIALAGLVALREPILNQLP